MFINETTNKWSQILTEDMGISGEKNRWMSQLAAVQEIKEGLQSSASIDGGIYSTPLNTMGMGNPSLPYGVKGAGDVGNTGADFHNAAYGVGSGDALPMSNIPMALNVAAMTIGLELVPVVVSQGPWAMLSYMDFPYAGGKLGRINETAMDGKGEGADNKPIYIKVSGDLSVLKTAKADTALVKDAEVSFTASDDAGAYELKATFIGFSRIDSNIIVKIDSATYTVTDGAAANCSIADVFSLGAATLTVGETEYDLAGETSAHVRPELVSTMTDHVPEFSNFFDNSGDPMTRGENETGVGNTIGARMYTKMVQMGSFEVTGSVTRQQLQDMPLYGVDVIGKVMEAMQNELSQSINKQILTRVFQLGVTNAVEQKLAQNVDLNLFIAMDGGEETSTNINAAIGAGKYVGIDGVDYGADWEMKNVINNTSADNIMTAQRRISSRILAAANVITQVGRRGRPNWVVTNSQVVTALQDNANFVIAPMTNSLSQDGSQSLYFAGTIAGLSVYVDPYMTWDDTRICVGRKGDGNSPGVVFMPYILADTVQTVVEGTMAPKLLVNSRFAIVDAGWYPETMYYTFIVSTTDGNYYV